MRLKKLVVFCIVGLAVFATACLRYAVAQSLEQLASGFIDKKDAGKKFYDEIRAVTCGDKN
jgi:hypothetical protein